MKTVKHLSVLLAVLLVVSLLVVGFVVNAEDAADVTIGTPQQFVDVMANADNLSKKIELTANIDLSEVGGNTTVANAFTGTFDGKNYTISGITQPLFKTLKGTVQNLTLDGVIEYNEREVGSLANNASGYKVINVVSNVDMNVKARDLNVGGIIGYPQAGTFENVTYAGDTVVNWYNSNGDWGAIAGYCNTKGGVANFINCTFAGTVTMNAIKEGDNAVGTRSTVGAMVGCTKLGTANFTNCVNIGTVTYNLGEYTPTAKVSGIVGFNKTGNDKCAINISNCVDLGTVVGTTDIVTNGVAEGEAATSVAALLNATHVTDTVEAEGATYKTLVDGETTIYVNATAGKIVAELPEGPAVTEGPADTEGPVVTETPEEPGAPEEVPSFSEGTIAKGEDGKYTIDTDDFAAFVSAREGVKADTAEYRFVIAADIEKFTACENLNLVLNFVKGEEVVATATKNVLKELKVYASATAAGNTYVAADGVLLTGIVVKDIPAQAWETVTVTLVDGEEKVAEGKTTAADVEVEALPGTLLVSGQYNPYFSNEQNTANAFVIWMSDDINGMDVISKIHSGAYTIALNINGTEYTTFASKEAGRYLVLFLDESGVYGIKMGETYKVSFTIYDENGVRLYYTIVHDIKNDKIETPDAPVESTTTNIPLALSGLKQLTVDAQTAQLSVACWDSNPAKDAFDGNYFTSKMGTNKAASGQVTLTFSLTEAATVSYYTFYTGNDTCTAYPNRSPLSWTVYGKVGEEWVTLSAITETGMEEEWATPYNYKVATPAECKDYKIEFVAASDIFQLNEIVLYASDATATGATAAALMGDAVACMPHDLGYNADVARIRTTMRTDYVAPFPYIPGTETSSIKEITLEGAYAYVKDLTNNGEFVKYEVQEIETSRWCDLNFILEGFVPEAGVEYEILFFFMTGDNARTPNALHVLPMIFNKHNG